MSRFLAGALLGLLGLLRSVSPAIALEMPVRGPQGSEVVWHEDYARATEEAVRQRKLLLIFFYERGVNRARDAFMTRSLTPALLAPRNDRYVWARLPVDARITVSGRQIALLGHPAFVHMQGRQGVAVVDYRSEEKDLYGRVVSTFPFARGRYYTPQSLAVLLDLPRGSLTQRTLMFAVRIHPEVPASAWGRPHPVLSQEAQSHSHHQAAILTQGHHGWDYRFHRINARVPGTTAQEVVAESWPNQDLVEAAIDCVHSWRQSPGHWEAVRSRNRFFGYDMKRGPNGIWYATGIFAR